MPIDADLPPGQHQIGTLPAITQPERGIPIVDTADWLFRLTSEEGVERSWDWAQFRALPSERICVDLHSDEGWSVLASTWEGTPSRLLLEGLATSATFVSVHSYDGRSTNLPLEDLLEMPTWIAFGLEGRELSPELGGPARLLVPHLYLWKSAPWIRGMTLTTEDKPGFYESHGYHNYGDPWRQQRRRDN